MRDTFVRPHGLSLVAKTTGNACEWRCLVLCFFLFQRFLLLLLSTLEIVASSARSIAAVENEAGRKESNPVCTEAGPKSEVEKWCAGLCANTLGGDGWQHSPTAVGIARCCGPVVRSLFFFGGRGQFFASCTVSVWQPALFFFSCFFPFSVRVIKPV